MKLREALDQVREWLRGSRRRQIGTVGVGLGVLVAAIGLPLYFAVFAGGGGGAERAQSIPTPSPVVSRPTPTPEPTPEPTPTPSPTIAPAAFSPGDWVEVVAVEDCLDTFFFGPSPVSGPDCVPVPSGFVPLIVGGPDKTEGGPWWSLAGWGWVPEQSLRFHHRGEPPYPERPELADIGRIAFIAADGDVWIMNSDGSGKEMLLALPGGQSGNFRLQWSPDGSKLAVTDAIGGSGELQVISAAGDSILQLSEVDEFGGWSPRSDAFTVTRFPEGEPTEGKPLPDLVVLDLKGDTLIELPNAVSYSELSFSADGRNLAFFEVLDFGYCNEVRAQIVDLQTGEVQPIDTQEDPQDPTQPHHPGSLLLWSPNDPSLLAHGRLLINFDTGEERVLPGLVAGWSPDGRFLLLSVSGLDEKLTPVDRQVYDIATSVAALEWEYTPGGGSGIPCGPPAKGVWSPDGRYLAYHDPDDLSETFRRTLQIWDAASGGRRATLPAPGIGLGEFSPGGQHMLFGDKWISVMDIDGSGYTLLAEGTEGTGAAWQPQP